MPSIFSSSRWTAAVLLSYVISLSQALFFNSTALVIGADDSTLNDGWYLLDGYGIAFELLQVPQSGVSLPALETGGNGNYGLFVINAGVQYAGKSALTTDQWNMLYAYQIKYGVRMVQIDVIPSDDFGTVSLGSCCDNSTEQNLTLVMETQAKEFPTAGLRWEGF